MTIFPQPSGGRIAGTRHFFAVRAYYEDTDLSGVVYHANYLRWFERARSDLLRLLGIDQRAAVEAGEGAYAVADLAIRYLRPARLDDDVLIVTECTRMRAASCRMHQRALRLTRAGAEGEVLSEASLRIGFVAPGGQPRRQPSGWRAAFQTFLDPEPSVTASPESSA
ncbi:YbgC/FadM family acyl-CoA thioesterase [Pseudopontixanthobacter vadosimaris]|uniref:YbgC/FadM family acyl-CoA thioesterase n=1 Tax=Pseudopontixanthobacter vadosimaris TaxID=2726450 RepID=UPI0014731130|nr:YbgC/FadM family acyl-CoA thioesterase [Pseudopontixanthobacter vadosimaris]